MVTPPVPHIFACCHFFIFLLLPNLITLLNISLLSLKLVHILHFHLPYLSLWPPPALSCISLLYGVCQYTSLISFTSDLISSFHPSLSCLILSHPTSCMPHSSCGHLSTASVNTFHSMNFIVLSFAFIN